jgi:hypothetical protein
MRRLSKRVRIESRQLKNGQVVLEAVMSVFELNRMPAFQQLTWIVKLPQICYSLLVESGR